MLGCAQNISLNFTLFQHLFSQSVKKALISYGLYEAPSFRCALIGRVDLCVDISEELQACLGDVSPLTITVHCKKKKYFHDL